ncbi:MAG: type II toxin-antitoxin system PemK/MazF family toxin [Actinomycetota bacterium]
MRRRALRRGEIYWADLPGRYARRPILIVTRSPTLRSATRIVAAPVTRHVRALESEIDLGPREGLRSRSAASCDNLQAVSRSAIDPRPVGRLARHRLPELDAALRYALEIRCPPLTR